MENNPKESIEEMQDKIRLIMEKTLHEINNHVFKSKIGEDYKEFPVIYFSEVSLIIACHLLANTMQLNYDLVKDDLSEVLMSSFRSCSETTVSEVLNHLFEKLEIKLSIYKEGEIFGNS